MSTEYRISRQEAKGREHLKRRAWRAFRMRHALWTMTDPVDYRAFKESRNVINGVVYLWVDPPPVPRTRYSDYPSVWEKLLRWVEGYPPKPTRWRKHWDMRAGEYPSFEWRTKREFIRKFNAEKEAERREKLRKWQAEGCDPERYEGWMARFGIADPRGNEEGDDGVLSEAEGAEN